MDFLFAQTAVVTPSDTDGIMAWFKDNWILLLVGYFLFKDQIDNLLKPKTPTVPVTPVTPTPVTPTPIVVTPPPAPVVTIPADHPILDLLVANLPKIIAIIGPLLAKAQAEEAKAAVKNS